MAGYFVSWPLAVAREGGEDFPCDRGIDSEGSSVISWRAAVERLREGGGGEGWGILRPTVSLIVCVCVCVCEAGSTNRLGPREVTKFQRTAGG